MIAAQLHRSSTSISREEAAICNLSTSESFPEFQTFLRIVVVGTFRENSVMY
jgi:hypothetical protein